ncbi:MAG: M56 family metallopeptidase [Lachnospiraceae bacterium]
MIEHILASTILIFLVILLRRLFQKRISKRLCYAMWLFVAFQLLVPMTMIPNRIHVMNFVYPLINEMEDRLHIVERQEAGKEMNGNGNVEEKSVAGYTGTLRYAIEPQSANDRLQQATESAEKISLQSEVSTHILSFIWLIGAVVCALIFLVSNLFFYRRLKEKRCRLEEIDGLQYKGRIPVYWTDEIKTPCLYGLFHPTVYVTEESLRLHQSEEEKGCLKYILTHEMMHYRHKDHIWAVIRCLCVVLYWYHPLVWIAARMSMEDSELACDEGVLMRLGKEERMAYGEMLIALGTDNFRSSKLLTCATGISGSKQELQRRIQGIVNQTDYKKGTLLLFVVLLLGITGCTVGNPKQKTDEDSANKEQTEDSKAETEEDTEKIAGYRNNSVVVIRNLQIVQGKEEWEAFKKACKSKMVKSDQPIRIQIEVQFEGDIENPDFEEDRQITVVSYDGEAYYCDGQKWKYLLDVTGETGIPKRTARQVVLANEIYTYGELEWSVLSNSSDDWISYQHLFYVTGDIISDKEDSADASSREWTVDSAGIGLNNLGSNVTLYPEPVEGEVCIAFTPALIHKEDMQSTWYYVIEDETLRTKLELALAGLAPVHREENGWWENCQSLGCAVWYNNREWELYSGNRLSTYIEQENGEVEVYVETPDTNWNCVNIHDYLTGILKEKLGYETEDVTAWTNISSATLEYYDRNDKQSYSQTITDKDTLEKLQSWFSGAEYLPGGSGCPFDNTVLTLELAAGKKVKLQMAEDDCPIFRVNGVYYNYAPSHDSGKSFFSDEVFELFNEVPAKQF